MKKENNCIVYRHIRLDKNEPFYIGIGTNIRRPYSNGSRNKHWHNIVSKTDYKVQILFENLTWQASCQKEIEFIKLYGRKDLKQGTLVNMTNGGDGTLGLSLIPYNKGIKTSNEQKEKLKLAWIKRKKNFEHPMKSKKHSEESIQKMKDSHKNKLIGESNPFYGKSHSEETKKKISETKKSQNKKISIEQKIRLSEVNKGKFVSIETNVKKSVSRIFNKNLKLGLYNNFSKIELENEKSKLYNLKLIKFSQPK